MGGDGRENHIADQSSVPSDLSFCGQANSAGVSLPGKGNTGEGGPDGLRGRVRFHHKIVMLFFVGAFLGDITETLFCRVTAGVWMSRSSVVWGPFSIVWGLAIAAVTALLYRYRKSSDSFLFLTGTFLGEPMSMSAVCSQRWLLERYSGITADCPSIWGEGSIFSTAFFWGIAAVGMAEISVSAAAVGG